MYRMKLAALAVLAAAPVMAHSEPLCPGHEVYAAPDGRLFGHLPYAQAPEEELVLAPAGFAAGAACRIRREMLDDLKRLLAAAAASPEAAGQIRAISCFRPTAQQRRLFCGGIGPGRQSTDPAERARYVAPPGHSEHSTGFAIDFGVRPSPNCGDVNPCIAATSAGRWLIAHAADYGFEMSFPALTKQGVSWEPWHWRWVGTTAAGAGAARTTFAQAQRRFPAAAPREMAADQTPSSQPAMPQISMETPSEQPSPPAPSVPARANAPLQVSAHAPAPAGAMLCITPAPARNLQAESLAATSAIRRP